MNGGGPYRESAIPIAEIVPEEPRVLIGLPEKLVEEYRTLTAAFADCNKRLKSYRDAQSQAQAAYDTAYAVSRRVPNNEWYVLGPLHVEVVRTQALLEKANNDFVGVQTRMLQVRQTLTDLLLNNLLTR